MKKTLVLLLSVVLCFAALTGCGNTPAKKTNLANAKSLADLEGCRISAQVGTFHEEAMKQIKNVVATPLADFPAMLVALNSGVIDGYIAEEPTALNVCLENSELTYVPLKNNDTGFTATKAQVGIAVGLKKGSDLKAKINEVLAGISEETKAELMQQAVNLAAGKTIEKFVLQSEAPATTNGVLRVGMECAYKPFNWTELNASTIGAVPISSQGLEGQYANGYDVQIAQYIANKLGMKLEIYAVEWNSLVPSLKAGTIDAVAAGMSPTPEREIEIDFSNLYYESNLVVITKK